MKIGIYIITNIVTDTHYIGLTRNIDKRFRQHKNKLNLNKHCNIHFQRSWNKYGSYNFEFGILEECPENMLAVREKAWYDYYKDTLNKKLFNLQICDGLGNYYMSQEIKDKISKGNKGKTLGVPKTKEHCNKISKALIGRFVSKEWKNNISKSKTGMKQTKKAILNHAKSVSIPIFQLDLDGNIIKKWCSSAAASRHIYKLRKTTKFGTIAATINKCIRNDKHNAYRKSAWGYKWSYCNKSCVKTVYGRYGTKDGISDGNSIKNNYKNHLKDK